jgi:tetratricopeptide (TPR) repeat protein
MRLLHSIILGEYSFNGIITRLVQLNHHGSDLEQAASRLLTPLICSSLGSLIASRDIYNNRSVSPEALTWLSLGLNSDVASSRLKLASVYYCVGDFRTTEYILSNTAEMYDQGLIENIFPFYVQGRVSCSERFSDYSNIHNELSIRHCVAYCVRFIPEEVHCQPPELQYEMFRSTQEDRAQRHEILDCWMDWAVVDSLPYLYFLQYKTYRHLQRYDEQQQALNNLVRSIHTTRNLWHKETALNLLGQCHQQENRYTEALHCYMNSLHIRPTNNTAKLHICRLLYAIYTNPQPMH